MGTVEARAATTQFRSELDTLADLVALEIRSVVRTAQRSSIDRWWRSQEPTVFRLVAGGFQAAATLAERYLRFHARVDSGAEVTPIVARPDPVQLTTALGVAGPVAFKKNMARTGDDVVALRVMRTRLVGSAQRLALGGARQTTTLTIARSPQIIGFRRVTGPNPCDFCSMLAGRGAVYKTSDRAAFVVGGRSGQPRGSRRVGQSYHDHCNCSTEPIWG